MIPKYLKGARVLVSTDGSNKLYIDTGGTVYYDDGSTSKITFSVATE